MTTAPEAMTLGVVLERRNIDNPWQPVIWRAVAVIPGAAKIDKPRVLIEGPDWVRFHAATLVIELHRDETEGYKHNISNEEVPVVYVLLRVEDEGDDDFPRPTKATVSPYEAQAYLDCAGTTELVEPVPMPEAVQAWVRDFVAEHHVDAPFEKRGKKRFFALHDGAENRGLATAPAPRGESRRDTS